MTGTPEEVIRAAVEAYVAGDNNGIEQQLGLHVRIIGSEQRDNFDGRDHALHRLGAELERRRRLNSVGGTLVDAAMAAEGVYQSGDMAWWSGSGNLNVDGTYHNETSWTVVLNREGEGMKGEWKIVHSHFSIHR
jgi:SnoaL-like domain